MVGFLGGGKLRGGLWGEVVEGVEEGGWEGEEVVVAVWREDEVS